jgi:hypothetical protein
LQATPEPAEFRMVDPSPHATCINEPAVRVEIREQERSEPGTPALGISPANHYELLPVLAFDLDPQPAIAGRIGHFSTLRDDALQRHFADLRVELRTTNDLVIAVLERRADIRQQTTKPFLSLS